jgi:DNA-binding transcriptional LysR family regulator
VNLRNLRTFVAVADAGSIARASAHLNLSQPAASRQILVLEESLKVKLFDRMGRRFRLTSEGETLLQRSRRLIMDADALNMEAQALTRAQAGLLRVGATPQTIESVLVDFLAGYRSRHPAIEVHLVEEGGLRLAERLERGDVHLALVISDDRFRQERLFPVYAIAVVHQQHRLRGRRKIDVRELAEEPVLLLTRSFASRVWFDAACNLARVRPRVLLECASPHTIVALAAAGFGAAIVPSTVLMHRSVHAMPIVRGTEPLGNWGMIAWDPLRSLAPYAEQFIRELATHCRRVYPGRNVTSAAPALPPPKQSRKPPTD